MVLEFGMSDKMGMMRYTEDVPGFAGSESQIAVSEETRREIDQEIRAILDTQYQRGQPLADQPRYDRVDRRGIA